MFSLQKQNMMASSMFDFPEPFGPITLVKSRNGPTYVLSTIKHKFTSKRFEIGDSDTVKFGKLCDPLQTFRNLRITNLGNQVFLSRGVEFLKVLFEHWVLFGL